MSKEEVKDIELSSSYRSLSENDFGDKGNDEKFPLFQGKNSRNSTSIFLIVLRVFQFLFYFFGTFALISIFVLLLGIVISFSVSNSSILSKNNEVLSYVNKITSRLGIFGSAEEMMKEQPQTLILQLTIDQLRSDEIQKYRKRFLPDGGWNRLIQNGIFFRNSHYRHSLCVTPVGHSTLATGGNGLTTGIVAHNFLDESTGTIVTAAEDGNYTEILGKENVTNSAPTRLLSTTTGDELLLFTNASKSFSISEKDYVAPLMGGHLGKAFWYSTQTGNFITTNYYYKDAYPSYVTKFNEEHEVDDYQTKYWDLSYPESEYHFTNNRQYVNPPYNLGKTFPKPLHNDNPHEFYDGLLQTPYMDFVTWEFAKKVIEEEQLGKRKEGEERNNGNIIDYLSISFSCLDKIGHTCGPNSVEKEDGIYKLDLLLKNVFEYFDEYLGLDNILIILSSDHGVDLTFQHSLDIGFPWAKKLITDDLLNEMNSMINETLFDGTLDFDAILSFPPPNLYFKVQKIKNFIKEHSLSIKISDVEELCAEYLRERVDIAYAVTKTDLLKGNVPQNPILERVQRGYHPRRSGDVVIVQNQHIWMSSSDGTSVSQHGSPYDYDNYVPIFFMGKDISKGEIVNRRVGPEDIAPTITTYFDLKAPTGCLGNPLPEVLRMHGINANEN